MQYQSPFSYKPCATFGLLHFVQYQRVLCIGLLCIASIRYLAGLYDNFVIIFMYKTSFSLLLKLSIADHASLT